MRLCSALLSHGGKPTFASAKPTLPANKREVATQFKQEIFKPVYQCVL